MLLVLFIVNLIWVIIYRRLDDRWFDTCMDENFKWYRVCNRISSDDSEDQEYNLKSCFSDSMHRVKAGSLIDAMKKLSEEISVPLGSISVVEEDRI